MTRRILAWTSMATCGLALSWGVAVTLAQNTPPEVVTPEVATPDAATPEAAALEGAAPETATPDFDEVSYTLGFVISHRLAEAGVTIDKQSFAKGFLAARGEEELLLSHDQMKEILDATIAARRTAASDTPAATPPTERAEPMSTDTRTQITEQMKRDKNNQIVVQQQVRQMTPRSQDVYIKLNGNVPAGRINTAVGTTRKVTQDADSPTPGYR